jgi:hypothetical protein
VLTSVQDAVRHGTDPTISITVWDAARLERKFTTSLLSFSHDALLDFVFHPHSPRVFVHRPTTFSLSGEMTTATLNLATGQWETQFWQGSVAMPVAFGPGGRSFVGKTFRLQLEEGIEVWDGESGRPVWKARGYFGSPTFSHDGKRLAAVRRQSSHSPGGSLVLFDAATGQELLSLPGASALHLEFDAQDHRIISTGPGEYPAGGSSLAVRTWDGSPLSSAPTGGR